MNRIGWKLLMTALACTVTALTADEPPRKTQLPAVPMPARDENSAPPDHRTMERLMQRKMATAQQAFAAVARGSFEETTKAGEQLLELSRQELWQQMASPRFAQDTADFVRAVELLERMAAARDSDGTALAFTQVALNCTNCHEHMRGNRVARVDTPQSDAKQLTARRF